MFRNALARARLVRLPTPTVVTQRQISSFEQTITKSALSPAPPSPSTTPSSTIGSSTLSSPIPSTPASFPPPTPHSSALLLSRLARLLMTSGHLTRSHTHLSTLLTTLHLLTSSPPLPLLVAALTRVSPQIRLVNRRKGTKSLPTPQPLTEEQKVRQAWKWIIEASEKRKGEEKVLGKRLAKEVVAVLQGNSEAIKKMEARHQQGITARANVGR